MMRCYIVVIWQKEYGKRKQMVSGIHFNFEYDQALIQQLYDEQSEVTDCKQFKTKVYMKVARNFYVIAG